MLLLILAGSMSYFIGFLIFVATLATTDTAFAVDQVMQAPDSLNKFLSVSFGALILAFAIGMAISIATANSELGARILLRQAMFGGTLFMILIFFIFLVMTFVKIMLRDAVWSDTSFYLLDTKERRDALVFIGTILGGTLATINAIVIYLRVKAQEYNNTLVEKGHIEDRFRFASEGLGNKESVVRISALYQFYYLAKHHYVSDFRKNIYDVLSDYLYDLNSEKKTHDNEKKPTREYQRLLLSDDPHDMHSEENTHDNQEKPTREYQRLLKTLFMSDVNSFFGFCTRLRLSKAYPYLMINIYPLFPFARFNANLQNISFKNSDLSNAYFVRATFKDVNFEGATLDGADFRYAKFDDKNLEKAKSAKGANFYGATIKGKQISPENLFSSHEKDDIANPMFIPTTIIGGVIIVMILLNLEICCGWKILVAIAGVILGMLLGAMLYTLLSNCKDFCRDVVSDLEHVNKRKLFFVIICALGFLFIISYCLWHGLMFGWSEE